MKDLTYKDLLEMASTTFKKPMNKPPTKPWVEKAMNKLGWYRQTEVLVIQEQKLMSIYDPMPIRFNNDSRFIKKEGQ